MAHAGLKGLNSIYCIYFINYSKYSKVHESLKLLKNFSLVKLFFYKDPCGTNVNTAQVGTEFEIYTRVRNLWHNKIKSNLLKLVKYYLLKYPKVALTIMSTL